MRIPRRTLADIALLLVVNTMWAAQYTAYKVASERIPPLTLSTCTFLLAALALLPFWLRRPRRPRPLAWRDLAPFAPLGILGLVPSSAGLAWGTALSTASNAALLALTVPILTALLAAMMLGERMTRLRWLSLALSLGGVLILSDFDLRHMDFAGGRYLAGNLLVLCACASSAYYNVYSKGLLRAFAPLDLLMFGYLAAVAVSLPFLALERFSFAAAASCPPGVWIAVGVLSIFSWGLAMVLWMFVLRRLDVTQASVSIYLLPFLGVLISAVTLGERIDATVAAGGLLTLAGTVLATVSDKTREVS
jgi:drug/metabolite transporter (DMT)-like permease